MTPRLRWWALVVLLGVVGLLALTAGAAWSQPPSALSPLAEARVAAHLLRVENAQLRAQVAELQAALDSARLTAERVALEQQLREELHPPADHVFEWQTQRFVPRPEAPQ